VSKAHNITVVVPSLSYACEV